ncbi:MAG: sugar phosphate isomerase/epimerase [Anaerolineae bacterium]|nr:sugar phosphate isomerase/epimerase [Anaerolineae bacterium]
MTDWTAYMDFGVVHPLVYFECRAGGGPIMETLPTIVNDEMFGAIEIAPIKDPAVRKQARDLLASAQMQVVYLPILPIIVEDLKIASVDGDERAAVRSRMKTLLDEALEFDSPLAMITGPRDPGVDGRADATERLVEDLQELCDYAAAKSSKRLLNITFEHFDRDIEKKRLIGPTSEAVALVEAVNRPNFGLTVDLSHLPLLGESSADALRLAASHAIHMHIGNCVIDHADAPIYGDFHPRFGHPLGRNDLPQVIDYLEQLDAIDYWGRTRDRLGSTPILSMELRAFPDESPEAILANGKRTFIRAWHSRKH